MKNRYLPQLPHPHIGMIESGQCLVHLYNLYSIMSVKIPRKVPLKFYGIPQLPVRNRLAFKTNKKATNKDTAKSTSVCAPTGLILFHKIGKDPLLQNFSGAANARRLRRTPPEEAEQLQTNWLPPPPPPPPAL